MYLFLSESKKDKCHYYNLSGVRRKRQWLKEVLLSSSSDDDDDNDNHSSADRPFTDEDLDIMLREHKLKKHHQSHFYQNEEVIIDIKNLT